MTDTPTPTPMQRLARAYTADAEQATRPRVAATHDPADDAEADRIAAIGATVALSPDDPTRARISRRPAIRRRRHHHDHHNRHDGGMSMTTKTKAPDLDALRAAVAEGERAEAYLAEQERARQERNTAALAEAQQAWAVDLCTRAPDLDADLAGQRREALVDLDAAVQRDDIAAALAAWRREAAARFTQRSLNTTWREAHTACGVGQAPREPGLRDHDADELLRFTAALDGAANRSAGNAAQVLAEGLLPERPTMAPEELLPPPGADLRHGDACPGASVEVSQAPVGRRSHGTVARCLGCGASQVLSLPPEEPEEARARSIGAYAPGGPGGAAGSWS